jgi:hypothetical protein
MYKIKRLKTLRRVRLNLIKIERIVCKIVIKLNQLKLIIILKYFKRNELLRFTILNII